MHTNRNENHKHSVQNATMENLRPQPLPPGPGETPTPAPIAPPRTPAVAPQAFDNVEVLKVAVPKISAVRFSKEQFMTLSPAERELLIRVGIMQNDLMVTNRLWGAHVFRQPPISKVASDANVIQQMTTLFLFLGKLFEAIRVFETHFQRTRLSPEYQKHFNSKQLESVRTLNAANGKSGLWAAIRNSFAFHPHDADLSKFMDACWDPGQVLSIYFGDPDGNSMSSFAVEPFYASFMHLTGKSEPQEALRYVQQGASGLLQAFRDFAVAIQTTAIFKMLGTMPTLEECSIDISEFLPQDHISLPFFMAKATRYNP